MKTSTVPSILQIFKFIFRHDKWLSELRETWEIERFVENIDKIANTHDLEGLWVIDNIKERARAIVAQGAQQVYYDGLDTSKLFVEDESGTKVRIHEAWFGRVIRLDDLIGWLLKRYGAATKIVVDPSGMVITTSRGVDIKVPDCEIYLGRLYEDGMRYLLACHLIAFVTRGLIKINPQDVIGKTQYIRVLLTDIGWEVSYRK